MDSATSGTEQPYTNVAQSDYLFSTSTVIPGLSSVTRYASSGGFHATWSKLVVPQTGYWTDEQSIIGYALPRYTGVAIDAVTTSATTSAGTLTLISNKVAGGALWDLQWVPESGTTIRPINVFDYGRQVQTSVFMTQWQDPTDPSQNTGLRFFSPLEGGDSHTWISTTTPIQIGDTELAADAAYMNGSPCLTATTGTDSLGRPFQTTEALPIEWWPDNAKNSESQRLGVWVSSGDILWKDGPHNSTAAVSPGIIVYPKWRIGKTAKILTKAEDQSAPPNGIPVVEYTTRVTTDCDIGSAWVSRYPAIVEMPIAYLTEDYVFRYDYYPSRQSSAKIVAKRLVSKGDRIRDYDKAAIILSTKAPSDPSNTCFAIYTSSWPIDDAITADPFASSMDAARLSLSTVQPTTGRKADNCSLISVWREFPHRQEVADTWNANTQREFKAYLIFGTFKQVRANIDWLYQKGY